MTELETLLTEAKARKIIDDRISTQLLELNGELATSVLPNEVDEGALENEAPRFVRGFHDVLITIGIVALLGGLWALSGGLLVPIVVFGLAEWFVKRRRLVLPAFALTAALALVMPYTAELFIGSSARYYGVAIFFLQVAVLALYYWRYRVPVALAALFVAGFGFLFFLIAAAFGTTADALENHTLLLATVAMVFALVLFVIAMRFDLSDRVRETRRSDVAFWLHLMTAPLLLFTTFFLLFGERALWWSHDPTMSEALVAFGLVTVMAMIGLVIDRRAFVTSGLLSLGTALAVFWQETGLDLQGSLAGVLVAVGLIVLLIGSGWRALRRAIVTALPEQVQSKLPPV